MPTQAELQGLLANCDVEWTTINGVKGRKFKGKANTAYASNSVFLPAAGLCRSGSVRLLGSDAFYWSSTPYNGSDDAYSLYFISYSQYVYDDPRNYGCSVRAVLAE